MITTEKMFYQVNEGTGIADSRELMVEVFASETMRLNN